MTPCVILQNIIIKDERELNLEILFDNNGSLVKPSSKIDKIQVPWNVPTDWERRNIYTQLRNDLI
jgi:hypothetical protein